MNDERTEGAQEINLSVRKIEQSVERRKGWWGRHHISGQQSEPGNFFCAARGSFYALVGLILPHSHLLTARRDIRRTSVLSPSSGIHLLVTACHPQAQGCRSKRGAPCRCSLSQPAAPSLEASKSVSSRRVRDKGNHQKMRANFLPHLSSAVDVSLPPSLLCRDEKRSARKKKKLRLFRQK